MAKMHFVLQAFNKLTLDTFLKHFFFKFYMYSSSAMKSRRNGTEVEFRSRRNGSRRNGSRRNGTNHRRNGSRRNGSRRNGSDSYKNLECRRNGTDLTFESRRNGSRQNGSRRNGSRRNGSRRNFNARNKCLNVKHLKQRYRHHKLRTVFSKFYHRHHEMVSKFNVGLKPLLHQGLSEPEFHCDFMYTNLKRLWVGPIFLICFEK